MKEGLIALNYECSKCNERMGLYERKSAVLDGDFEWVCSTITSQNIYGRTPMILLTMRLSRLFVKIRCHAVASTRKRSAIEEGRKITDVAREFDIAHSVVSRLWKSFKTTGMCSRWHGGGRVRSTTPAQDRYIVLSAKRNRRTTAQQVANQFLAASGKQISRKTVARRLRGEGLYARRRVVCVPLTRQHRTARLQWCREHHNWTEQDWACVLFSDESRFSLSSD
ncbi:HTH_Tnp_Tc3_2 domain-containing protein [Trichonephila clavipes]|nr:HTH_Tnp_Tc3_2 domain-containing protein [Trichonephila clavipes]